MTRTAPVKTEAVKTIRLILLITVVSGMIGLEAELFLLGHFKRFHRNSSPPRVQCFRSNQEGQNLARNNAVSGRTDRSRASVRACRNDPDWTRRTCLCVSASRARWGRKQLTSPLPIDPYPSG